MNKYVLAVKKEGAYVSVSEGSYVENPEALATNTQPYFMPSSKKGIQGAYFDWAKDSGTKNTLVNLHLNDCMMLEGESGSVAYSYKGKTYYFNKLSGLKSTITQYCTGYTGHKMQVSMVLLMPYESVWKDMIHPSARKPGAAPYYMLNTTTQESQERLEALFSYLGEVFGQEDCLVSNWILGNEINSCSAWNYKGSLSFDAYIRGYAQAFHILHRAVRISNSSSRVFISLDNAWNTAVAGYTGKATLDAFAAYMKSNAADADWHIAYHPYSAPLTQTAFWNNNSKTTNSVSTKYISMKNLSVLTDYAGTLEKKYGMENGQIRVILAEQGWTSSGGNQYNQAKAIAWAYYIAEFNSRVDSFIIRAEIDDRDETKNGLYLGLKNLNETKKTSYYVYKYMDTPTVSNPETGQVAFKELEAEEQGLDDENLSKFKEAQNILGRMDWEKLVKGYDKTKLDGMEYGV